MTGYGCACWWRSFPHKDEDLQCDNVWWLSSRKIWCWNTSTPVTCRSSTSVSIRNHSLARRHQEQVADIDRCLQIPHFFMMMWRPTGTRLYNRVPRLSRSAKAESRTPRQKQVPVDTARWQPRRVHTACYKRLIIEYLRGWRANSPKCARCSVDFCYRPLHNSMVTATASAFDKSRGPAWRRVTDIRLHISRTLVFRGMVVRV